MMSEQMKLTFYFFISQKINHILQGKEVDQGWYDIIQFLVSW